MAEVLTHNQTFASPKDAAVHYGVKGMHWGVRNEDAPTGRAPASSAKPSVVSKESSDEEVGRTFGLTKKQAAIGAGILLSAGLAAAVYYDVGGVRSSTLERGFNESTLKIGEAKLQQIFDNERGRKAETLPKGQTFSRMSRAAEETIRRGAYATYKPDDVANYKAFWSQKGFQINIEALKDIKMPDLQTRLDTMTELIKSDKTVRQDLMSRQRSARAKLYVKTAPAEDLAKYTYARFDAPDWKRGTGKKYLEALNKKGYGAMLDHVDSGSLSKDPVILINEQLFHISSRTKMTQAELDDAYKTFKGVLSS